MLRSELHLKLTVFKLLPTSYVLKQYVTVINIQRSFRSNTTANVNENVNEKLTWFLNVTYSVSRSLRKSTFFFLLLVTRKAA